MLRRLMVVATLVFAVAAIAVSTASATSIRFISDVTGQNTGWVVVNQKRDGSLELNVQVRRADANTNYSFELWCGPTHATAGNLVTSGQTVTTNASGAGSALIIVSAAELAVCGPGDQTGHIDLEGGASSALVASPINFTNP